jgi:hypothetical protein
MLYLGVERGGPGGVVRLGLVLDLVVKKRDGPRDGMMRLAGLVCEISLGFVRCRVRLD